MTGFPSLKSNLFGLLIQYRLAASVSFRAGKGDHDLKCCPCRLPACVCILERSCCICFKTEAVVLLNHHDQFLFALRYGACRAELYSIALTSTNQGSKTYTQHASAHALRRSAVQLIVEFPFFWQTVCSMFHFEQEHLCRISFGGPQEIAMCRETRSECNHT